MDQLDGCFTRFPNYFLDKVMSEAGGVEWKVICTVIRDTLGWHDAQGRQRQEAEVTIARFEEMTGAKRSRLFEAITDACRRGAIKRPGQGSFRFRPLPKTNLQPVPKRGKSLGEQSRLPFSESENRTLPLRENPIIGLAQSENRTVSILRKKERHTHKESVSVCRSKYSRDFREEYADKHGLRTGWLKGSESGACDEWIDLQLERDATANKPSETIHERLRREGVV